nr:MAG: DNA pilot protein [Microvirus sp.]
MGLNIGGIIGGAASGYIAGGFTPAGAVAGGVAGAASGYGVSKQNVANAKEAKINRKFSSREAQKQKDFQERMSNTSHQRQIKDLKKAGLNPILSATSGASSPGGASGSGAQARHEDTVSPAVNSALNANLVRAQIAKINAETDNTKKLGTTIGVTADVAGSVQEGVDKAQSVWEWIKDKAPTSAKDWKRLEDDYRWLFSNSTSSITGSSDNHKSKQYSFGKSIK